MIEKIRYKVSKVLPLVYDDALSYYEVLSKLITVVNDCIDACNENETAIDTLQTEVTSLAGRMTTAESNIRNAADSIGIINSRLDGIDDELDGIDEDIAQLSEEIGELPTEATVLYEHYIEADNDESIKFYSNSASTPTSLTNLKFKLRNAVSVFVEDTSDWCYILNTKDILSDPEGIKVYYVGFTNGDPVFKYKDITFTGSTITDTVTQL